MKITILPDGSVRVEQIDAKGNISATWSFTSTRAALAQAAEFDQATRDAIIAEAAKSGLIA